MKKTIAMRLSPNDALFMWFLMISILLVTCISYSFGAICGFEFFLFYFFNFIYICLFTGNDPANEDHPNSLRLILRGSPDRWLNVPSKGHEGKPSAQFLG